jgi:hypothetical protein
MPDVPAKAQDDPTGVPGAGGGTADEKSSPRPSVEAATLAAGGEPDSARARRNPIFSDLVQGEEDLPGLVGYALYKLSKRDWLAAFAETHRREPTQDEIDSYILGEHTQRRIATYRRLAEELITRKTAVAEKQVPPAGADISEAPPRPVTAVKGNSLRSSLGREASNGADARSSSGKLVANGSLRRSGATTLIFWLLVLLVLVGLAWVYMYHPSLLHALTG